MKKFLKIFINEKNKCLTKIRGLIKIIKFTISFDFSNPSIKPVLSQVPLLKKIKFLLNYYK